MSEAKRHLITQQVNRIMTSLHAHYLENSEEKIAERFGTIVLMLSNIFVSFLKFDFKNSIFASFAKFNVLRRVWLV